MFLADLIDYHDDAFGPTQIYEERMIAKDSGTGKVLFDTRINKPDYIRQYYNRKVGKLWIEMREATSHLGFTKWYEPVLMCYLDRG